MRADLLAYLARLGLQQGPTDSTTPHRVGYACTSEPEPEEDPMPQHVPAVANRPTCVEASRSEVVTVTLALSGQAELRDSTDIDGRWFAPRRMRVVVGTMSGRPITLIGARITGTLTAREHHREETTLVLRQPGAPGWPSWARKIVMQIMSDIEAKEAAMGGGKEDAGSKDAREELEKLVEAEEKRQAEEGKGT